MRVHRLRSRILLCRCPFLLLLFSGQTSAQEDIAKYPSRPITFIVPYSAGGSGDLAIRLLGKEAEKHLGQPIVVMNKPGGGAGARIIGVAAIATAKPDGYTIGQSPAGGSLVVIPFMEKIPYHPLTDLKYVMQVLHIDMGVIVKAESPFKTFKDLLAYAQQNPKKLTYGTNAPNSIPNLIMIRLPRKRGSSLLTCPSRRARNIKQPCWETTSLLPPGNFPIPSSMRARPVSSCSFRKSAPRTTQVPITKDLAYDVPCPAFVGIAAPKGLPDEIAGAGRMPSRRR